ncbi:low temperature requirement protein A [Rugosimonospora africana]|uniref:Low temperature requirement A protein (LtrA) n=1 Tax=Rugosimonospora africana TaxID=556532 RepID=A0A8J3R2B2_9ACTN|nr:hypothetical protein Raf01_70630 [Rugosimonospora africana]
MADDLRVRGGLWGLALAIDYIGFAAGFRRRPSGQVAGEHFAERLQQFLLIALGEVIFVAGRAFSTSAFRIPNEAGFGQALVATVLLWPIYLHRAGTILPMAIGAPVPPAGDRVGRRQPPCHDRQRRPRRRRCRVGHRRTARPPHPGG